MIEQPIRGIQRDNRMNATDQHDRARLDRIAKAAMTARGLLPDFSLAAQYELGGVEAPGMEGDGQIRDLRKLLWASIDNDDSRDLDQLTVAESLPGGRARIFVAVADVDAVVKSGTAIDEHARHNTTSVYTAGTIFPMLPEKLSTDITSLNPEEDRLAVVVEMTVDAEGSLLDSAIYRGYVRNRAKLAYSRVAAWLEDGEAMPEGVAALPGLDENLRLQDQTAQQMKRLRQRHGALSLETLAARPIFEGDTIRRLEVEKQNRAKELIADFMIAANGVTARYLAGKNLPSLRRVVRTPKRWEAIVEIARRRGFELPERPEPKPLDDFLMKEKAADPLRFPDLSLTVIKLLGKRRIRGGISGRKRRPGAFRAGRERLQPLDGPQPPLSGYHHAAVAEGRIGRQARALRQRGNGVAGQALQQTGGRRAESRAASREIRRGAAAGIENRRAVRRHRDGGLGERHVGPAARSARGREIGAGHGRAGRGPRNSRATAAHRCRDGFHRLQADEIEDRVTHRAGNSLLGHRRPGSKCRATRGLQPDPK